MAASPRFKVINPQGEYVASCKHLEDAACLVALYGDDAKIRDGSASGQVLWAEGCEQQPASESYDYVRELGLRRIAEREAELAARYGRS